MKLIGTKVRNLVGRPAGPHQGKRERLRRLKQLAAGQLQMDGAHDAAKTVRHFTAYSGELERLAS